MDELKEWAQKDDINLDRVCVCVRVYIHACIVHTHAHTRTHTRTRMYAFLHVCVFSCMYVWMDDLKEWAQKHHTNLDTVCV